MMKIYSPFGMLLFFLCIGNSLSAQYVTIPDANFATWLKAEFPECMNGNQIDTGCTKIKTTLVLSPIGAGIKNLEGVQYFTSLKSLNCSNNSLDSIQAACMLPSLTVFICAYNNLKTLPALPPSLYRFSCAGNFMQSLPALPNSINDINVNSNLLTVLPKLPSSLKVLAVHDNKLNSLPALPTGITYIDCSANPLDSLPPVLPDSLKELYCFNCELQRLPALPSKLNKLYTFNNSLTTLPALPGTLEILHCANNNLYLLPELPKSLKEFYCNDNHIGCFPVLPDAAILSVANNPFKCLPNHPLSHSQDTAITNIPLCIDGDAVYNPYGCKGIYGITGKFYQDDNADCIVQAGETPVQGIALLLYNDKHELLERYYSSRSHYEFAKEFGDYIVKADTAGKPFRFSCPPDSAANVSAGHTLDTIDFAFDCMEGFDNGVFSIASNGWVFPGRKHELNISAGDMSARYGLKCPGNSGKVRIEISGPVSYAGYQPGALEPSDVTGNILSYDIADFSELNIDRAFRLYFKTDTSAQFGDSVCVHVTITPVSGDRNHANNTMHICYRVLNSHDPNMKEVYPALVLPAYSDWLTYTIHFQNTGSAPAFNIRLADTLDAELNAESFELMQYSHPVSANLSGRNLSFYFKDIMLQDSNTSEPASHGFVQYRIKPKASLADNRVIRNTAYIYFDYNEAIVTNAAETWFRPDANASVKTLPEARLNVYPNPGSGRFYVQLPAAFKPETLQYEVLSIQGTGILSGIMAENRLIDLGQYASGLYILKIKGQGFNAMAKLVKE